MPQQQVRRRQTVAERLLREQKRVRIALEAIQHLVQRWMLSQGQPSIAADDRVPHAIELHATKKVG
jgi:hypothetical protein